MYCWRQLRLTAEHGKIEGMREALALEYMKKLYLQKCFKVLSEYTQWNRENTEKSSLSHKFYDLNLMMKSFKRLKTASKKYKGNRKNLKNRMKEFTLRKEMMRKKAAWNDWEWAYQSKIKVNLPNLT